MARLIAVVAGLATAAAGAPLPLEYNWNGMAHATEQTQILFEVPSGFRSISDRGLIVGAADTFGGTTFQAVGTQATYNLVSSPGVVDSVMIGNRAHDFQGFDTTVDSDNVSSAPSWDPTGGTAVVVSSTTTFASPIAMTGSSVVSFLAQASNGGGQFEVTLTFTDGSSIFVTVDVNDWFANSGFLTGDFPFPGVASQDFLPGPLSGGDGWAGTERVDAAVPGQPLGVQEVVITAQRLLADLAFDVAGRSLASVTFDATNMLVFQDRTSVAIIGLAVNGTSRPLNVNWNAMNHLPSEVAVFSDVDSADGYRAIADRGLRVNTPEALGGGTFSFSSGGRDYDLNPNADEVDIIFVGRRDGPTTVTFDDVPANGDDRGVAPAWDPTGGTGELLTHTSAVDPAQQLSATAELGLLYHASRGGTDMDVTLGFDDGGAVTVRLNAPDWFANFSPIADPPNAGVLSQVVLAGPLSNGDGFDGVTGLDGAIAEAPLNVLEAVITRDSLLAGTGFDVSGRTLTSLTFATPDTFDQAVAVFAASLNGATAVGCRPDFTGDGTLNIFDIFAFFNLFGAGDTRTDFNGDGTLNIFDIFAFFNEFGAGCP